MGAASVGSIDANGDIVRLPFRRTGHVDRRGSDTLGTGSTPRLIGIALTSHDNDVLATVTFDVALIP